MQAALQGCASAQLSLGEAFRDGSCGAAEDWLKARCLFQLAAQQGCPDGAFALADLLLSDPERFSCVAGGSGLGKVQVSGVTMKDGLADTWCCGQYIESAQVVNRRAVYRKVGDGRFALWYDEIGMWRLGDTADIGSTVGRASVESSSMTPQGPHSRPWTAFVWSGREIGGEWQEQPQVRVDCISPEQALSGAGGAAWEPVTASADDTYQEACRWLREAARKNHEPALRRMKKMGLSTFLLHRDRDPGF